MDISVEDALFLGFIFGSVTQWVACSLIHKWDKKRQGQENAEVVSE